MGKLSSVAQLLVDLGKSLNFDVLTEVEASESAWVDVAENPGHSPFRYNLFAEHSFTCNPENGMAMNTRRVVISGLVAGVVANILGFLLFGLWLGPRFESEMTALAPSLAGKSQTGTAITLIILSAFVVGLVLAWLYAAIRPRFGPGLNTAIYAGIVVWILGFIFHLDLWIYGITPPTTYMMAAFAALVQTLATALVAGAVYRE